MAPPQQPDLSSQLAAVFDAGLRSDPSLRESLAEALARDTSESYTKAEVNYRESDRRGERCGRCSHYEPRACNIVAGSIDPAYVCDEFNGNGDGADDAGDSADTGE